MIIVKQLNVGGFDSNFSYLIYDEASGEAAIIDPCGDIEIIRSALSASPRLIPRYILLTHSHGDHTSGVCEVNTFFNAPIAGHPKSSFPIDTPLADNEKVKLGETTIECIYTPGHTDDSVIYHICDDSAVFTGDTLFIDWCGYCNPEKMFDTMRNRIFPLADTNEVYSGHNYGSVPHRPLGIEKLKNPYLNAANFAEFRNELKKL